MNFVIEVEREEDGRIIAKVLELAGVLTYGQSREEAIARTKALALRVLAGRLEHGEAVLQMTNVPGDYPHLTSPRKRGEESALPARV